MSELKKDLEHASAPDLEDQINAIGFGKFQMILLGIFSLLVVADGMELVCACTCACVCVCVYVCMFYLEYFRF
jgi:hypothetical protein